MSQPISLLILKAALSGIIIVAVNELVKKNNLAASIVHSLPLVSVTALIWMFVDTKDTALITRHSTATFWFVLPTLPLFLILPWLLRNEWRFWPTLGVGLFITVILYLITLRLLKTAGVNL